MKNKTLFPFLLLSISIIVGMYYIPYQWVGDEPSEVNYKKMTFKVSLGEYGTLKSPPVDFFKKTFEKDLNEEELGDKRTKFLVGPSISQKVEDDISKENPDLHPRIISYKTGQKLNEYLLKKPQYWRAKGLFSMKLWKRKKENLGSQKCSIAVDIFSADHVLTSMGKSKDDRVANKIRKFIVGNYKELIAPCKEYNSSHVYSSMVMDEPDVSTLPERILSKISEKVVKFAKKELESARKTKKRLKSDEINPPNYDESLVDMNIETKKSRLEKFSKYN